ncbi:MAG TPA: tRNA (adenosine(37)-N6)-threonylcarbamoyltransferase complex ATPase subunit type 1 TsaE [Opitutaceae bacterium]
MSREAAPSPDSSPLLHRLRAGVTTASAEETRELAAQLAALLPPDTVLALHGDLGVGKTTFVQGLAAGFGITETVTSPTFAVFVLHRGGTRLLGHLDAYRIENAAQTDALLLEEFLVSPWCLAVEWPEKMADWLPANTWHLDLGITTGERHTVRLR